MKHGRKFSLFFLFTQKRRIFILFLFYLFDLFVFFSLLKKTPSHMRMERFFNKKSSPVRSRSFKGFRDKANGITHAGTNASRIFHVSQILIAKFIFLGIEGDCVLLAPAPCRMLVFIYWGLMIISITKWLQKKEGGKNNTLHPPLFLLSVN